MSNLGLTVQNFCLDKFEGKSSLCMRKFTVDFLHYRTYFYFHKETSLQKLLNTCSRNSRFHRKINSGFNIIVSNV